MVHLSSTFRCSAGRPTQSPRFDRRLRQTGVGLLCGSEPIRSSSLRLSKPPGSSDTKGSETFESVSFVRTPSRCLEADPRFTEGTICTILGTPGGTGTGKRRNTRVGSLNEVAEVLAENLRIFKVVLNHPHIVQYK